MTFRTAYGPRDRVPYLERSKGRTRQEMKQECDINFILARYKKTGQISHLSRYSPMYGDAPVFDLREGLEQVRLAMEDFMNLPASVRKEFDNDAVRFVEFCGKAENLPRMVELGLAERKPPPPLGSAENPIHTAPPGAPDEAG